MREALIVVMPGSSRAVSTAAIILAASFGLLLLVPLRPFQEIGFTLATGVLLDALLVRSLLMPALLALLGRASGWPGRSLRTASTRRAVPALAAVPVPAPRVLGRESSASTDGGQPTVPLAR
jgi:RND superfamily putative drug exporter